MEDYLYYAGAVHGLILGYSLEAIRFKDFCAGAIHKKFESNDDSFFDILLPSIRCNKNNNIYGYGIKLYK